MRFFRKLKIWKKTKKEKKKKVVVIGLDGVPFSLVWDLVKEGCMPNFASLLDEGCIRKMTSSIPTVSSVAWSCFMTGKNPGKHGIYGFTERKADNYDISIPNSQNLCSKTLWEILSQVGKNVVVMGVPVTYPPIKVNGILISGFLAPTVDKATYPSIMLDKIKSLGYRLDIDVKKGREDKKFMIRDLNDVFKKRTRTMLHFLEEEKWNFFMTHFMETDRLHHFFWDAYQGENEEYRDSFYAFYKKIDEMIGIVKKRIDKSTTFVVCSDHGFCGIKQEVYLNKLLEQEGWISYKKDEPKSLDDLDSNSKVYSLDPGRVYINLKGREPRGSVEPSEYEEMRKELASYLIKLRDPETGEKTVEKVLKREDIYSGPQFYKAPDLVILPKRGYDFKGGMKETQITGKTILTGMHTYDDAMVYISNYQIMNEEVDITDLMPTILDIMGVPIPEDLDGKRITG